jgi:hypothetical protein
MTQQISTQALWDRLSNVDQKFKTPMITADGKTLTSVNPYEAVRRMTEIFGPCGVHWGIQSGRIMDLGDTCQMEVTVWYKPERIGLAPDPSQTVTVVGWGGVRRDPNDPDLYKKMFTNGFSKAMSYLGFASEVYFETQGTNGTQPDSPKSPSPPPPAPHKFVHTEETPREWKPLVDYFIETRLPALGIEWKWRVKGTDKISFYAEKYPNGTWEILKACGFQYDKARKTHYTLVPMDEVKAVYNMTSEGGGYVQ